MIYIQNHNLFACRSNIEVNRYSLFSPVQPHERVGLTELLKKTYWFELLKVRQTLCWVGDRFNIPNGILLDVKNFRQLVILMRYDSFCFAYQKTPSVISYHLQKTLCRNTQRGWAHFQAAVWKHACQSVYHQLKNMDGWKICCLLTGWTSSLYLRHWCCLLVVGVKQSATKRCSCMSQGLSCTNALIFSKAQV